MNRKESFIEKIIKAYKENYTSIICGMLMLNGSTNVYRTYVSLCK